MSNKYEIFHIIHYDLNDYKILDGLIRENQGKFTRKKSLLGSTRLAIS